MSHVTSVRDRYGRATLRAVVTSTRVGATVVGHYTLERGLAYVILQTKKKHNDHGCEFIGRAIIGRAIIGQVWAGTSGVRP